MRLETIAMAADDAMM